MLLQRRLCPWGSLTKSGPQGVTYVQTSYKTCWGAGAGSVCRQVGRGWALRTAHSPGWGGMLGVVGHRDSRLVSV